MCLAQDAPSSASLQPAQNPQGPDRPAAQPQAPHTPPTPAQQPSTPEEELEKKHQETTGTSNDRLFWALPNFLAVGNSGKIPPLTSGQKFKVVARTTFDPVEGVYVAFISGIGQATNSEPGFGQGAAGYGKRLGATFADNAIENFMTGAILPSLLHQDPRYYQLGEGGGFHRAGYAISRIFITRSDSGHKQFNFSEVMGSAISAGISTYAYHPAGDRNVANATSVWGTQVGWDTMTTVVREFWPDIRRKMSKKKPKTSDR